MSGIVGSIFMDLLDLMPAAGIRFIPVRHEQSAAHMEDGYARVTGWRMYRAELPWYYQHGHRRSGNNMGHTLWW